MTSSIVSKSDKRGINPTLYDPRINSNKCQITERIENLKRELNNKDRRIGFAHSIDTNTRYVGTKYGKFQIGSTLSHQLRPFEHNFKILSNIVANSSNMNNDHDMDINLPYKIIHKDSKLIPGDWGSIDEKQKEILKSLVIEDHEAFKLEKDTITQSNCRKWFDSRKNRLTSSKANLVFIRKRNFKTLVDDLLNPKPEESLPPSVREALKHGKLYETKARNVYEEYMNYSLKNNISVRETGIVIQPNLYWLAASPDGLVFDNAEFGLIEIKCPYSKREWAPEEMLQDEKFYVKLFEGKPILKQGHSSGYYTQIQMDMGLCGLKFCDFVVYTFKGMIISRTLFDEHFFISLVERLNLFYKDYMLPNIDTLN